MFTRFMDMHSGGGQKENFAYCYIEAPIDEAKVIFYKRFGHNPERVTCTCCGEDYSLSEDETLEQATAYERGCKYVAGKYTEEQGDKWREYIPLREYLKREDIQVILATQIKDSERIGSVPAQGYVWID